MSPLVKHADGSTEPVAGAVVDLCATGMPAVLAATYSAPIASACDTAATWVATATTGSDGKADFGLLPPGAHYCAVETHRTSRVASGEPAGLR